MWGREVACGIALSAALLPGFSPAQQLVWREAEDFTRIRIPGDTGQSLLRLKVSQHLDYAITLSGGLFINWKHDQGANQVMLIQDLVYQCRMETRKGATFSQKIVHHLGVQYFPDSIAQVYLDDNQAETRIEWKIRRYHGGFLSLLFSTRLCNRYQILPDDSGNLVRTLSESFLTPLTGLFSGGIQFRWPAVGSLNIGLTSAKLTWIRDRNIYEILATNIYYGVPEEKRFLFEYGLSIQLLINHDITRWLHWDCDLLIFKNTNMSPDIILRNNLGFRLARFLRARMQTRVYYEERVSNRVQMENIVSAGLVVEL